MRTERKSKFYVFLIEILWCVLFLALSSIVCTHFFVKGSALKDEAVDKSKATILANNIAEALRLSDEIVDDYQMITVGHYQKQVESYLVNIYTIPLNSNYSKHKIEITIDGDSLIEYVVVSEELQ